MTTRQIDDEKTRRWAEALRMGMAVAEGGDVLAAADRIQILDAEGNVLFTAEIGAVR